MSFTSVGESACADSWGKALKTGEPALTIPCYAERRYGGVADDELLMAIPPRFLPKVVDGLAALSKNGLRYPIPPYSILSHAAAWAGRGTPASGRGGGPWAGGPGGPPARAGAVGGLSGGRAWAPGRLPAAIPGGAPSPAGDPMLSA